VLEGHHEGCSIPFLSELFGASRMMRAVGDISRLGSVLSVPFCFDTIGWSVKLQKKKAAQTKAE